MPREFQCIDCGDHVVSYTAMADNDQDICAKCLWLRAIEDPEDREMLRALLNRLEVP
jgi:hypothetical protein